MARLRVGGPVPCRKRSANLHTMSGRPEWGTFQGLGMPSTVRQIRLDASKAGVRLPTGGGCGHHNLDPRNLCHRIKRGERQKHLHRQMFERARLLSFQLDRMASPREGVGMSIEEISSTHVGQQYRIIMTTLSEDAIHLYRELLRRELSRGSKWADVLPTLHA
jgi:hypothetical protein